ncbi:redoxin domain-containing protein [Stieleria varia]|uniref:Thiol-disulfide oxidoreductase ResA n=1 Tax=Stieleria varia TaxID=2528005 RepID=A0A5C6AYS1_9BACT|nr:redoxin domain-containing protein [Stieleria varia]TWU04561.1 Thiol-disulfide oxidoreductase ResA [Stieleria varia]
MKRKPLIALICLAALAMSVTTSADAADSLTIGSKAPKLDIEHWVQDGNGQFEHVTEFKKGKVYVVEFWATWCGPCIMSMPHLADLQNKYRDKGVQIISVSSETLKEVNDLLGQTNPDLEKTFAEITAPYTLTVDPDRSVYEDYMEASNQDGIPCSFLIGKTGQVEWIGHPMELDQPLEEVIADKWDREAYKKVLEKEKQFQESMQKLSQLAGNGKFDEAIAMAEEQLKTTDDKELKERWTSLRYSLMLSAGKVTDEVLAFYRNELKKMKGNIGAIGQFSYSLYGLHQQGGDVRALAKDAVAALSDEIPNAPKEFLPLLYNTVAQLHSVNENYTEAIEAQQKAVDTSEDPRQQKRLMPFLDELKSKAKEKSGDTTDDAPAEK